MKKAFFAVAALGLTSLSLTVPAQAQVTIRGPGVAIETGQQPYWREHREAEWRERRDFREAEHRRREWLRDHCVRDWNGHEYCR